ncbi:MAG: hypothetical protein RIF36_09895 [Imperialibacter sp.]|uniref:hypothetical protein n=1 Tax=Imperialibacter sp. TaxID=2038411 RepID=UPI0032ECE1E4
MKKVMSTAAMLVMVTSMALASKNTNEATKSSQVKITQSTAMGIYNLRFDADSPGQVTIKIANEKGNTLMKEKIAYTTSFERPYNLQDLPDGTYRMTVERDGKVIEETIQHVKNRSAVRAIYDVDVEEVSSGKYQLVVKKTGHQAVKVKITDKNGVIFFNGAIDEMGSFSKTFDLSNIVASDVKMEVTMGDKTTVRSL